MMGTKAIHLLGDISRSPEDFCIVSPRMKDGNWIGRWITGLGLVSVKFPKDTTRPMTPKEHAAFRKMRFGIL